MTRRVGRAGRLAAAVILLAVLACGDHADPARGYVPPESGPEIVVDSSVRHQVISGWEAATQAGELHPSYPLYRDSLLSLAVDHLGLNRLRLEARSGLENSHDWYADFAAGRIDMAVWRCHRYAPVNDDADPGQRRDAGFHFTEIDGKVEQVVLPMRARLAARGESLYLNLTFVAFARQVCSPSLLVHDDPDEYAEFVLATVQHLDSKYGLVPDAWEVILEPDNTDFWRGGQIGRAIVVAAARLAAHGYDQITFIGPSTTNMSRASDYFEEIARVPGAANYMSELAYHRYGGVSIEALEAIADRAESHDVGASMLEHIGADYEELHEDLAIGNAIAWQQFALAFPIDEDNGAQYYLIDVSNPAAPRISAGSRTPYLRQYFHFIRRGARRIGAASRVDALDPIAFINADGRWVVVIKSDVQASFAIGGLPAGRYGVSHTTASGSAVGAPITVAPGAAASLSIPGPGVLTLSAQP